MYARPPEASGLSKHFIALARKSGGLPPRLALSIAIGALVLVAIVDRATGPQVNPVLFYLLVTCFSAWCLGEWPGLAIGVAGVAINAAINGFHFASPLPHQAITIGALAWNTIGRLLSTTIVVLLASGLRGALDLERWRGETDGLTGVLNKGAFAARMDRRIAAAKRDGSALVLAYIDLDGFKHVNDSFGHGAGDDVLRAFARNASEAIRSTDLVARIGGDEFVVLLTVSTCDLGDVAAERLHYRLSQILRDTGRAVTCSMGALVIEAHAVMAPAAIVDAADRLMYDVKRMGKNAIRIARGDLLGIALDASFPPQTIDEFAPLLADIDHATRGWRAGSAT